MNMTQEQLEVLDFIIQYCKNSKSEYFMNNYIIDKTDLYLKTRNYSNAKNSLKNINDELITIGTAMHQKYILLSIENEIFQKNFDKAIELINTLDMKISDSILSAKLLRVLAEMYKAVDDTTYYSTGSVNSKKVFKEALEYLQENTVLMKSYRRSDLILLCADILSRDDFNNNKISDSLHYVELKKQIDFTITYSGNIFNGNDNKKISFIKNVDYEKISTKIFSDDLMIYCARNADDIYIWFITIGNIKTSKLELVTPKLNSLLSDYSTQSASGLNTVDTIDSISNLFTDMLGEINNKKRIIFVADKYCEQIPFEAFQYNDQFIADKKKIVFLSSLYSLDAESKPDTNGKSKIVILNSGGNVIDSLEQKAIKQSGIEYTVSDNVKDIVSSKVVHMQYPVYYDELNNMLVIKQDAFKKYSGNNSLLVSSSQSEIDDVSSFAELGFASGYDSVIFNNSAIRDVNSAVFAGKFYMELKTNGDVVKSYDESMKSLLNDSRYFNTPYWSGIRLYVRSL